MVKAADEAATRLVTVLTAIGSRRVRAILAHRRRSLTGDMTAHALLSLDGRILVVNRVGFSEVTRHRVTRITVPAVRDDGRVHGGIRIAAGVIGGIVV